MSGLNIVRVKTHWEKRRVLCNGHDLTTEASPDSAS